jgi:hypothetical protein
MSKKHFVRLALELSAVLAQAKESGCVGRIETAVNAIIAVANSCAAVNDNFDRARFYTACGM